ncbi:MAG: lysophospholipid acyltransferase family protein [Desulfobacteraceae bacterium]|jgi:1-acyl-sn-glycerol-3-phosphate acyltransferase
MLRFFFLNAFIAIHTIIFSVWALILSIFDKRGRLTHFYAAVPWAKVILWVCGARVKVKGRENVDRYEPRIYLSNHQSYFDIFTLLAHLPADFKFLLKQELMRIPLFGFAMKRAGYIAIDREEPRKAVKSINEAVSKINEGASMLIFPEGTRSEDGKLQPFKTGGFRLALKAGCDVVPVAITNSRNIVPKGSLKINKGTIAMNIGTPISVKGYSKKDMDKLMAQVREAILSQMGVGN